MSKNTFSDSWHLVAEKHACLLPSVETQKQYFRGERWYVLRAPFKNDFYRLSEAAYFFVARMRIDKTIDEAWRESMERDPDNAPGQQEVIEVLGQLNNANLIHSDLAADSQQLYKAHKKRQQKMTRMQLLNFLFLKIPLFNPDRILNALKPIGKLFINPFAFVLWIGTIVWALKLVLENFSDATSQSSGFLAPENVPLILVITIALKAFHELSHGIFCKYYGGYVPTFGVMLILFAPLPYVDATSSWSFRSRFKRIAVSFAGMYVELFIAAIATIIWANTGHGMLNSLAYNTMVIASVTTLIFNFNPLLKFDGYYIFVDLMDLPNLQQRSNKFIQFLLERIGFGYKEAINPAQGPSEWGWLGTYAIAAAIYRMFLMVSISFLLAERFFEIGLILGIFTLANYIVIPCFKFLRYLTTTSYLYRNRKRAWFVVSSVFAAIAIVLTVVPFPEHFKEPGIVLSKERRHVHTEANGRIEAIHVQSGNYVEAGQHILTLSNQELHFQIEEANMRIKDAQARYKFAASQNTAELAPMLSLIELEQERLAQLEERLTYLEVKAPASGIFMAPHLKDSLGQWVERGSELGRIGADNQYEFISIISQKEAASLFNKTIEHVEVRLWGQSEDCIPVSISKIIPSEQNKLPSAALGWLGGGEVEVDQQDPNGQTTVEPFFQIIADIPNDSHITLVDERSGNMRFTIGERPLLFQWIHDVRKVLQKRLKV